MQKEKLKKIGSQRKIEIQQPGVDKNNSYGTKKEI